MKTAKEMFEELGYEVEEGSHYLEYYQESEDGYEWKKICFYHRDRTFHASENYDSMCVDMKTFKAIHQQMKELGWLDE